MGDYVDASHYNVSILLLRFYIPGGAVLADIGLRVSILLLRFCLTSSLSETVSVMKFQSFF